MRDREAVHNRQRKVRVSKRPLELFLRRIRAEVALGSATYTVCLVSDAEIARMNELFRKKKGPTDVLSFPAISWSTPWCLRVKATRNITKKGKLGEPEPAGEFLGDIAIAPETARRYAKRNGRALGDELRVLILHGVLHLLGYDHETDRGQMERLEQRLRQRLGLA